MSSNQPKPTSEREPLQFDTAEPTDGAAPAATALACTACGADISKSYYEVGGSIVCVACRGRIQAQLTGGSATARFASAVGLGLVAAAAGSALYYAILKLTGYEIGLVAIVVGFLVGAAVRRGSRGRGGRAYQVLAVGLTYFAIVTTYIPFIVKSIHDNPPPVAADSTAARPSLADTGAATAATVAGAPAELQGSPSGAPVRKAVKPAVKQVDIPRLLLSVAALLALAAMAPVLAGFQNIIGMVIIGFALFEAWRQNQRLELAVTGPYRVGAKRDEDGAGQTASG